MELTKNQKIMKITALVYALCFIATGLFAFLLFPDILIGIINSVSAELFPSLPNYPVGENKFWLSMTISMMTGVTALSIMIYRDVRQNYRMAIPLCLMKFVSSAAGAGFFISGFLFGIEKWTTLANLVILITDLPLGLFMLYLYYRVKAELQ